MKVLSNGKSYGHYLLHLVHQHTHKVKDKPLLWRHAGDATGRPRATNCSKSWALQCQVSLEPPAYRCFRAGALHVYSVSFHSKNSKHAPTEFYFIIIAFSILRKCNRGANKSLPFKRKDGSHLQLLLHLKRLFGVVNLPVMKQQSC